MDPFTHTLVGLTAAKAGLERLSPLATTICVLAANSPDSDVVVGLTTDRWNYLHHHRGITHSIVGVIALAVIVPTLVWLVEHGWAKLRMRQAKSRYRGLLLASAIATATHPLMDWTNNYGVRPFLPWSGRWFYGDLVFIVDPFILLLAGGAAFLATSNRCPKIVLWGVLGAAFVTLSFIIGGRRDPGLEGAAVARFVLLFGVVVLITMRVIGVARGRERLIAASALGFVICYWGGLALAHRSALRTAVLVANNSALQVDERVSRVVAMPTLANPARWFCVAETDRAIYRFSVKLGTASSANSMHIVDGYQTDAPDGIERFEKPIDQSAALTAVASQDRRARILVDFARFPIAHVPEQDCLSQTIVQFSDLRYTKPGSGRGTFSLNVPVECASK
jgi:inner membrane protein